MPILKLLCHSVLLLILALAQFAVAQQEVDETQIIASDLEENASEEGAEGEEGKQPEKAPIKRADIGYLVSQQRALLSATDLNLEHVNIEADQTIHGFWRADQSGDPIGAVLLLQDLGENPIWPETILNMHEHLPLHGWATLSIELETIPDKLPPKRVVAEPKESKPEDEESEGEKTDDENSEAENAPTEKATAEAEPQNVDETQVVHQDAEAKALTENTETNESAEPEGQPYNELLNNTLQNNQTRIKAALDYLNSIGQFNVVLLGVGFSGYQVLEFTSKNDSPAQRVEQNSPDLKIKKSANVDRPIRAIVLVDTLNEYTDIPNESQALLDQPQIPVLDVTTTVDQRTIEASVVRKRKSKQKKFDLYIRRELTPPNGTVYMSEETELTRTVRGFLKRYAAGTEL